MAEWITECPDPDGWRARLAQARQVDGCLVWTGRLDRYGYGIFKTNGRQTGAHRAAWLSHRGPIAPDLVIDHLCRNRACVNPDHLEVVTNSVNVARGELGRKAGQHAGLTGRLKTECLRGHPFDDQNTRWSTRNGYMIRVCRACQRARLARFRARQSKKAPSP